MSSTAKANILAILVLALIAPNNGEDCVPRSFGYGSVVCVCNATYCDSASVDYPDKNQYRVYESGQSGKRLSTEIGNFSNGTDESNDVDRIIVSVDPNQRYQNIFGFGGAFTDAAGINIKKLSKPVQDKIIESYYSANGSRYSMGRVPAGGTDFSTRPYTYDDRENDTELASFNLAKEDYEYKIPFIKDALKYNPNLKLVSAAWSAPPWMKNNDRITGYGFLKSEYYQTFADYLVKFLLDYKKHGINIWGISTGNEPDNGFIPAVRFNSMAWTPKTMADWVANNLGPTIARSESNETLILMLDDQRFNLPWYVIDVFNNSVAKSYIAGVAVHWYFDYFIGTYVLDSTHNSYPDKFLLMTEACIGSSSLDYPKVRLGDWNRAETYILSIIENLNHWMTGWLDWNLALDKEGGPNWVKNFVDSPIIVNPETDEFFKQPMFYALAHFSKFVPSGSTRIKVTTDAVDVKTIGFLTPDDETVVVLYNRDTQERSITITDPDQGNISMTLPAFTIKTIIYKR